MIIPNMMRNILKVRKVISIGHDSVETYRTQSVWEVKMHKRNGYKETTYFAEKFEKATDICKLCRHAHGKVHYDDLVNRGDRIQISKSANVMKDGFGLYCHVVKEGFSLTMNRWHTK